MYFYLRHKIMYKNVLKKRTIHHVSWWSVSVDNWQSSDCMLSGCLVCKWNTCVHIEQKTQVMSHTSWTCDCQVHCWPAAINLSLRSVWGYFQAVVWLTLITVYHLALTHCVVATGACKGSTFSTMKAPQTRQDLDARAFLILVLTVSSPWNDH